MLNLEGIEISINRNTKGFVSVQELVETFRRVLQGNLSLLRKNLLQAQQFFELPLTLILFFFDQFSFTEQEYRHLYSLF